MALVVFAYAKNKTKIWCSVMYDQKIYLASTSPRRYELLKFLSIPFEQLAVAVFEQPKQGELTQNYVIRLAKEKAQAGVKLAEHDLPVLGADTLVTLDNILLEKPKDKQHAAQMLRHLSGKTHQVLTAIAFADRNNYVTDLIRTEVEFRPLSEKDIHTYIATGEPMDKAGAYAIQGFGGGFIKRINGSYHGVVGLPLVETRLLLDTFIKLTIKDNKR